MKPDASRPQITSKSGDASDILTGIDTGEAHEITSRL
jgi:hypothetical protein